MSEIAELATERTRTSTTSSCCAPAAVVSGVRQRKEPEFATASAMVLHGADLGRWWWVVGGLGWGAGERHISGNTLELW